MTGGEGAGPGRGGGQTPRGAFGEVLHGWLQQAGYNQKGLAAALGVHPSTISGWLRGHKRPDVVSLVKLLVVLRSWLGPGWSAAEALDGAALVGWDWGAVHEAAQRLQCDRAMAAFLNWWAGVRPVGRCFLRPPGPALRVARVVVGELAAALTALAGYRQARWGVVVVCGLAGSGKSVLAQAVAEDEPVQRVFRDGCVWLDGCGDVTAGVERVCAALGLERRPWEGAAEAWRRWAGVGERRLLVIVDGVQDGAALRPVLAGLGAQVVALVTTRWGRAVAAEAARWVGAERVRVVVVGGLAPAEGRRLLEGVVGRGLAGSEWEWAAEVGARVGWHVEALRRAALEGREIGFAGVLGELRAGRLPWAEVRGLLEGQWGELAVAERGWLAGLLVGEAAGAWRTVGEAAALWGVAEAVARRRLWVLAGTGLVEEEGSGEAWRWRVAPVVRLALGGDGQGGAG